MTGTTAITYDGGPDPDWAFRLLELPASHGFPRSSISGSGVDSHDWRGDTVDRMFGVPEARCGRRDGDVILMQDARGPSALREGYGWRTRSCREPARVHRLELQAEAGAGEVRPERAVT